MSAVYITLCAMFIMLGFEIRHRMLTEELSLLKNEIIELKNEASRIGRELKLIQYAANKGHSQLS